MVRWSWLTAGMLCIICVAPGCRRAARTPEGSPHSSLANIPDVPIAPGARAITHESCDGEAGAQRIVYTVEAKNSYALFYERACDSQGWHCAWSSGMQSPWCAVFQKPDALLIAEQRGNTITLYYGPRPALHDADSGYSSSSR